MSPIPVIDIHGLRSERLSDRQTVAQAIRQAAHEIGFFYITNHGIDRAVVARILAETKRFFDQPLAIKNAASITKSAVLRGFEPLSHQTLDQNALPDLALPDLKEGFYIGVERDLDDPLVQAGTPNHGANQWCHLPHWREHMEQYFAQMTALANLFMRGIALSLDLNETFFDTMIDNPMPILRLLHYPPHPVNANINQLGCGTHTDWGCLTILLQDAVGGLEVCTADGNWIAAAPIPDTFVINLGDLLARWTNDYYQSTPHRVVNRTGQERYSIPFFFDVNYHAVVECIATCKNSSSSPSYSPITAGEHIMEMYRKTYSSQTPAIDTASPPAILE